MSLLTLWLWPLIALVVLPAALVYFGLHVVGRGIIFVDLALAQIAALGIATAVLMGADAEHGTLPQVLAVAFTIAGAALFSLTRFRHPRVPHEAIIGIVYVAASAAAILVADKAPRGAEALHDVLEGSIIWITWPTIIKKGAAYAALGLIHFLLRKQFLKISFHPDEAEREGWHIRAWDFLFYVSFGVAVTMSVPVAGVLLVFTMLVVPAVVAFLFSRDIKKMVLISWGTGALASLLGLYISYVGNFPTGPLIVCMYALVLLGAGLLRKFGFGDNGATPNP